MKYKSILTLSLGGIFLANAQVFSQEQDTVDYRSAYNLILEQQWAEATENFESFTANWPDSVWADDAAFWGCYSVEQEESVEEQENFSCYQQFISNYPDSSWISDARTKLAVLGAELAALGFPEYRDQSSDSYDFDFDFDSDEVAESIERAMEVAEREMERMRIQVGNIRLPDMPDLPALDEDQLEDIRRATRDAQIRIHQFRHNRRHSADDELLAIVGALRDDERVSEILVERLESTQNSDLRTRIVLLLEDLEGDSIDATLLDVMENDDSEDVRNAAVLVLLDRENESTRERLLEIVRDESFPVEVRAAIIGELDDWDSPDALSDLESILLRETDPRLIAAAADALSDMETVEALSVLISSFQSLDDPGLRREIVDEIADVDLDMVMQFLTDVAASPDVDDFIAATAIDGIADRENNFAVAALDTIYASTENTQRKLAALDGMGDTETRQAVEVLSQILVQEDDPQLISAAVRALGDTEQAEAVAPVMGVYRGSDDDAVKNSAMRALRRLEDHPEALDAMLEVLQDSLDEENTAL